LCIIDPNVGSVIELNNSIYLLGSNVSVITSRDVDMLHILMSSYMSSLTTPNMRALIQPKCWPYSINHLYITTVNQKTTISVL